MGGGGGGGGGRGFEPPMHNFNEWGLIKFQQTMPYSILHLLFARISTYEIRQALLEEGRVVAA